MGSRDDFSRLDLLCPRGRVLLADSLFFYGELYSPLAELHCQVAMFPISKGVDDEANLLAEFWYFREEWFG